MNYASISRTSQDCTRKRTAYGEEYDQSNGQSKRPRIDDNDNRIQQVGQTILLDSQILPIGCNQRGFNYWDANENTEIFKNHCKLEECWQPPKSITLNIRPDSEKTATSTRIVIPYNVPTKASKFFHRTFEGACGSMIEKQTYSLSVIGHREEVVKWVLARMWKANSEPLNEKNVFEIYNLAQFWEIPEILDECQEYLIKVSVDNYDFFIETVKHLAYHNDMNRLEQFIVSDFHRRQLFNKTLVLCKAIVEYDCNITPKILNQLRHDIVKLLQGRTAFKKISALYKVAIDKRFSCDDSTNWNRMMGTAFYKKLYNQHNKKRGTAIEKVKNEIESYGLAPLLEEVETVSGSIEELENFVNFICLFSEHIKSIFFSHPNKPIKYYQSEDIELKNRFKGIIPKFEQFYNLEKFYFDGSLCFPDSLYFSGLLSKLDFSKFTKFKEIGLLFEYERKSCYSNDENKIYSSDENKIYYKSIVFCNIGKHYQNLNHPYIINDIEKDSINSFDMFLEHVTKQPSLKTKLDQGSLTISYGNLFESYLCTFAFFDVCCKYKINHTKIDGLEKALKQSIFHWIKNSKILYAIEPIHGIRSYKINLKHLYQTARYTYNALLFLAKNKNLHPNLLFLLYYNRSKNAYLALSNNTNMNNLNTSLYKSLCLDPLFEIFPKYDAQEIVDFLTKHFPKLRTVHYYSEPKTLEEKTIILILDVVKKLSKKGINFGTYKAAEYLKNQLPKIKDWANI